jgi:hypothetical protein
MLDRSDPNLAEPRRWGFGIRRRRRGLALFSHLVFESPSALLWVLCYGREREETIDLILAPLYIGAR